MDWTQDANMVFALLAGSDHGAGDLQDSTPNNNDFPTIADGKPDWLNSSPAAGYSGGYLDFNGVDAQAYRSITTEYFASQNMAIGAWFNPDQAMSSNFKWGYHKDDYVCTWTTANNQLHISFIKSGGSQANIQSGSNNDTPLGSWTHVVIVTDFDSAAASDTIFYKNGVSDAGTSGGSFATNVGTADRTVIGARNNDAYYDGKLDEIFLYIGGLTATDVNDIYDNGLKQATGQVYNAPIFGCAF